MNTNMSTDEAIHADNERMLAEAKAKAKLRLCSFCGKTEQEVVTLVAGPKVFICDGCVSLSAHLVAQSYYKSADAFKEIGNQLDRAAGIPDVAEYKESDGIDGFMFGQKLIRINGGQWKLHE